MSDDNQARYEPPPGGFKVGISTRIFKQEAEAKGKKKRRLQNACDMCRQVRTYDLVDCHIQPLIDTPSSMCVEPGFNRATFTLITRMAIGDSANMPGNVCSNCIAFNSECTHVLANSKKRGAPKTPIQPGEDRIPLNSAESPSESSTSNYVVNGNGRTLSSSTSPEQLEYQNLAHPGQELTSTVLSPSYSLPSDHIAAQRTVFELASYARSLEQRLSAIARQSPPSTSKVPASPSPPAVAALAAAPLQEAHSPQIVEHDGEEEGFVDINLSDPLRRFSMGDTDKIFYGRSSNMVFIKSALEMKSDYVGNKTQPLQMSKRPEFWNTYPWQHLSTPPPSPPLVFPSPTLAQLLVKHYFEDYNIHFPLLHRPSFERKFRDNLHLRDERFGLLLLSVCAIGSRFININDPRVLGEDVLEDEDGSGKQHSLGWKWYRQIGHRAMKTEFHTRPDVCELQLICNCIMFAQATSSPELCWALLGHGVRYAQECGVHRRNFGGPRLSVEKEQWKRAFWILVCIDMFMSAFLGRPRATNPVDYDLDLPVDCDDEYWEHPDPEMAFKQPPGVPSKSAFWVQFVKLLDIFGFAQRTIYAVRKPDPNSSLGGISFDQTALAELDQALNDWIDHIPHHLRWNPHMHKDNPIFFGQASSMYAGYYWVQIQIHRPFIQIRSNDHASRSMAYSSLAVCANAARSCSHVLDLGVREGGRGAPPFPSTQMALFNSAIVLLLNIWGGKRLGITLDPARELGDVYKCLNVLRSYEQRWQITGRLCDIITELISVGDIDTYTPSAPQPASLKRTRPTEEPVQGPYLAQEDDTKSMPMNNGPDASPYITPSMIEDSTNLGWSYGLPLHTRELSSLPIHVSTHDIFGGEQTTGEPQMMMSETDLSHIFNGDGSIGQYELHSSALNQLDNSALALWSDTPGGDRWEDWGPYVATMDELLRSVPPG
ncbi:Gypsy retrotransposon integrase-like protein 1 [Paramarasmius palmivorus]|uniref:Gypsy retrotransposon integrase-like protein 1 n=1 Tax=Paramarasmius palmivorus TaxID=297713 RepID=A0AAW0C7W2_9AGAR